MTNDVTVDGGEAMPAPIDSWTLHAWQTAADPRPVADPALADLHATARRRRADARDLDRAIGALARSDRATAGPLHPVSNEPWSYDGWTLPRLTEERNRLEGEAGDHEIAAIGRPLFAARGARQPADGSGDAQPRPDPATRGRQTSGGGDAPDSRGRQPDTIREAVRTAGFEDPTGELEKALASRRRDLLAGGLPATDVDRIMNEATRRLPDVLAAYRTEILGQKPPTDDIHLAALPVAGAAAVGGAAAALPLLLGTAAGIVAHFSIEYVRRE